VNSHFVELLITDGRHIIKATIDAPGSPLCSSPVSFLDGNYSINSYRHQLCIER
jgi:hypothetical protein